MFVTGINYNTIRAYVTHVASYLYDFSLKFGIDFSFLHTRYMSHPSHPAMISSLLVLREGKIYDTAF